MNRTDKYPVAMVGGLKVIVVEDIGFHDVEVPYRVLGGLNPDDGFVYYKNGGKTDLTADDIEYTGEKVEVDIDQAILYMDAVDFAFNMGFTYEMADQFGCHAVNQAAEEED